MMKHKIEAKILGNIIHYKKTSPDGTVRWFVPRKCENKGCPIMMEQEVLLSKRDGKIVSTLKQQEARTELIYGFFCQKHQAQVAKLFMKLKAEDENLFKLVELKTIRLLTLSKLKQHPSDKKCHQSIARLDRDIKKLEQEINGRRKTSATKN